MIAKNDASCSATQSDKLAASMLNKKEQATQPPSALCKIHCCVLSIVSTLLLFLLLFAAARLSIVSGSGNEQLFVRIGDQPFVPVLVDLLQLAERRGLAGAPIRFVGFPVKNLK